MPCGARKMAVSPGSRSRCRACPPGERVQVYAPIFTADGQEAVLPLLARGEHSQKAGWAASRDGGETWQLVDVAQLPGGAPGIDPRAWLVAQTGKPLLMPVQPLPFFANTPVSGPLRLVQVKMATAQAGSGAG